MKFRTGLLIGLAAGYAIAKRTVLTEDDPYVVKGPQRELPSGIAANPALRVVGERAQRLAVQATVASVDAILRTRVAIHTRLSETPDEVAAWN
jgi:hypothetical protein